MPSEICHKHKTGQLNARHHLRYLLLLLCKGKSPWQCIAASASLDSGKLSWRILAFACRWSDQNLNRKVEGWEVKKYTPPLHKSLTRKSPNSNLASNPNRLAIPKPQSPWLAEMLRRSCSCMLRSPLLLASREWFNTSQWYLRRKKQHFPTVSIDKLTDVVLISVVVLQR